MVEYPSRQQANDVAIALTTRWQSADPPKVRKSATGKVTRANGRILRVLRPEGRGLMLIYPIVPPETVEPDGGHPSKPTSIRRGRPSSVLRLAFRLARQLSVSSTG